MLEQYTYMHSIFQGRLTAVKLQHISHLITDLELRIFGEFKLIGLPNFNLLTLLPLFTAHNSV